MLRGAGETDSEFAVKRQESVDEGDLGLTVVWPTKDFQREYFAHKECRDSVVAVHEAVQNMVDEKASIEQECTHALLSSPEYLCIYSVE